MNISAENKPVIAIFGIGYVGLVSAICLAKIGNKVIAVDSNEEKIAKLQDGKIPIYEPDLAELLAEMPAEQRPIFTTDADFAINQSQAIFIAVGTPQSDDGSADMSAVFDCVEKITKLAKESKIIVTKSTVPAGTGEEIAKIINKNKQESPEIQDLQFVVASNPEFLREGFAVFDFLNPQRIIIGCNSEKSREFLAKIYRYFPSEKLIFTSIVTAEIIKYSANSFLAMKVAFINEMANLATKFSADINQLAIGIGSDSRIGADFLKPGPGFGGSCFPKDLAAINYFAKKNMVDLPLIATTINSNNLHQERIARNIAILINNIYKQNNEKVNIAIIGTAFKANTDDIRESPALKIADLIIANCITDRAENIVKSMVFSDPQAMKPTEIYYQPIIANNKNRLIDKIISFNENHEDAIRDADLIIIATEWLQYRHINWQEYISPHRPQNGKTIYDLRNIANEANILACNFSYYCIGKDNIIDLLS